MQHSSLLHPGTSDKLGSHGISLVHLSGFLLGASLFTLAVTQSIPIAAVACIPAGFALIATAVSINTLVQELTDEDKRGRVMGYLAMTFTGISPLGSVVLGAMVDSFGLPTVITLSGLACILISILFAKTYKPTVTLSFQQAYKANHSK